MTNHSQFDEDADKVTSFTSHSVSSISTDIPSHLQHIRITIILMYSSSHVLVQYENIHCCERYDEQMEEAAAQHPRSIHARL
jgi:hypothetical protein